MINNIILKKKFLIVMLILVANTVNGCLSSNATPSEVVKEFHNGFYFMSNVYRYNFLMSVEYQNSTDLNIFEDAITNCKPPNSNWGGGYYEFIDVINGSEKIEGDLASVEINYFKKDDSVMFKTQQTKKINLIKDKDGWRLKDLYCELK